MKLKNIFKNINIYLGILAFAVSIFTLPSISLASSLSIQADFSSSNGVPWQDDSTKIRINKIFVNYQDPTTGATVSGQYDVIFKWDPNALVLKPVGLLGCYNGSVRLHVSNSVTDDPIQGAVVTVAGQTQTTDDDGIARFSGLDGTVTVRVEKDGYSSNGFTVQLGCNEEKRVSIGLMPTP